MRARSVASLACRIIALWLGVNVVMQTVSAAILTDGRIGALGQFWAVIGTQAAVAWLLWISATTLGGAMAADAPGDPPVTRSNVDVHTVALSVVGVVLVVEAIPALIAVAVSGPGIGPFGPLALSRNDFGFFDRSAGVIANLVKLGIGALLVLRARVLAGWLARRYPEPTPPEASAGPAEPSG
jgi:hypothetical protein